MLINYFLSGWTANLGVVPLFSFAFFLSLPVFFILFFLLIRVCLVREPILKSFISVCIKLFKREFLSFMIVVVKVISIASAMGQAEDSSKLTHEIFLGRGEQIEISLPGLKTFSIGNKEVIGHRYNAKSQKIIIKGKSIGFSDMVVWRGNKSKMIYRFYISSKKEQLKKMESLGALKETELTVKVSGEIILVEGVLNKLRDYYIVKKLQQQNSKDLLFNLSLSKELRNKIFSNIYKTFLKEGADHIACSAKDAEIYCEYSSKHEVLSLTMLQNKFSISFRNTFELKLNQNFQLKFQFITIEGNSVDDLSLGLDKIQASLENSISNNQLILNTNDIFIQNQNIGSEFVSEQTLKVLVNEPFDLRIGTEIPYKIKLKDEVINEWKFSGLKVKGKLKRIKNSVAISYEAEISTPSSNGISGPRGKSTVRLKTEIPQILFTLSLSGHNSHTDSIPLLNEIPVLRNLFKTESKSHSHKMVICILMTSRERYE